MELVAADCSVDAGITDAAGVPVRAELSDGGPGGPLKKLLYTMYRAADPSTPSAILLFWSLVSFITRPPNRRGRRYRFVKSS